MGFPIVLYLWLVLLLPLENNSVNHVIKKNSSIFYSMVSSSINFLMVHNRRLLINAFVYSRVIADKICHIRMNCETTLIFFLLRDLSDFSDVRMFKVNKKVNKTALSAQLKVRLISAQLCNLGSIHHYFKDYFRIINFNIKFYL